MLASVTRTCINDYASDDESDDDYDGEIMHISSGATSSSFRPMMQQHQRPQPEDAHLSDTIVTPGAVIEETPIHLSERFPIKRSRSNSRVSPSLSNRIHLLHKKMNHPGREASNGTSYSIWTVDPAR